MEDIEGDLLERFKNDIEKTGIKKAKWKFTIQVLSLFRSGIIRTTKFNVLQNTTIMLRHNFIISIRTIRKNVGFSMINILGLTLGILAALYITIWVRDEMSFDRFHLNNENLYQVLRNVQIGNDHYVQNSITYPLVDVLDQKYPEIEALAITSSPQIRVLKHDHQKLRTRGYYANQKFFEIFSWGLISGNPDNILDNPNSIVISSDLAEKFFGENWQSTSVIGKTITINNQSDFNISGVYEKIPHNSSLQFDFVTPIKEYIESNEGNYSWSNSNFYLYLRTFDDVDPLDLSHKIRHIQNEHIEGFRSDLFLSPYTAQHLKASFNEGVLMDNHIGYYIRIFSIVAFLLILIASVNFINLTIARSMKRSTEIGVRKAIGAGKYSLINQFIAESASLVFIAFLLSIVVLILTLPVFNELMNKEIQLSDLDGTNVLLFTGIFLLTAITGGLYPAVLLSSTSILKAMKGIFRINKSTLLLRRAMVVFQLSISMLLITGSITVFRQMKYIQTKNLGLNRENVIYLEMQHKIRDNYDRMKQELLKLPSIKSVSAGSSTPLEISSGTHNYRWRGSDENEKQEIHVLTVNYDFAEALGLELIDGRDFDPDFGSDNRNYLINQKMQQRMGFDDPLGESMSVGGAETGEIIGVVKDFHLSSFYNEIEPAVIRLSPKYTHLLFVRTQPGMVIDAVEEIKNVYEDFDPVYPYEYYFLDEEFKRTYDSEIRAGKLSLFFTILAVTIAALGLLGLSSLLGHQRLKEISIRKVLGAHPGGLVILLSSEFILLICVAIGLSFLPAYLATQNWLNQFAYRTKIGLDIFLLAGAGTMCIALLIAGLYAFRVSMVNPVETLRTE